MEALLALVSGVLYAAGIYLMLRRRLAQLIIGLGLLSNGTNLLIFTAGGLTRARPPVVPEGAEALAPPYADPVPQAGSGAADPGLPARGGATAGHSSGGVGGPAGAGGGPAPLRRGRLPRLRGADRGTVLCPAQHAAPGPAAVRCRPPATAPRYDPRPVR